MTEKNVKTIIPLLVVLLAFALFMIFYNNQAALTAPNVFPMFMTLAVIAGGLLIALVYLVNSSKENITHSVSRKKTKSSKKKRK